MYMTGLSRPQLGFCLLLGTCIATLCGSVETPSHPIGIYCLDGMFKNQTFPTLPSFVSGVYIRINWNQIHKAPQVYNWTELDTRISHAIASGKNVSIGVAPGDSSPHWIYDEGAQSFPMRWQFNFSTNKRCSIVKIPVPWDKIYLQAYSTFLSELGKRYDANPSVIAIKATGVCAETMEVLLPARPVTGCGNIETPNVTWQKLGYTPQLVQNAWSSILNMYKSAFKQTGLVMMTGGFPFPGINENGLLTPDFDWNMSNTLLRQFAVEIGMQGSFQSNGVSAHWKWIPPDNLPSWFVMGAQALWYATGDKTCRLNNHHFPCGIEYVTNRTIQNAENSSYAWYEPYMVDLINPALQPLYAEYAKTFLN